MFSKASALAVRSSSPSPTLPPRKKQRLSSPAFDFDEPTQEDLAVFDAIDASLSHRNANKPLEPSFGHASLSTTTAPTLAQKLPDDSENPFTSGFRVASKIATPQFSRPPTSTTEPPSKEHISRSPSPEEPPPEPNHDDWFKPIAIADPTSMSFTTGGFMKVSSTTITGQLMPSAKALAAAQARMAIWETEDVASDVVSPEESSISPADIGLLGKLGGFGNASHMQAKSPAKRPALGTVSNTLATPATPVSSSRRPEVTTGMAKSRITAVPQKPAAFKSPLMRASTPGPSLSSPLNPQRPPTLSNFQPSSRLATSFVTPNLSQSTSSAAPPSTPLTKVKTRPTKFITPFKSGVLPITTPNISRMASTPTKSVLTPRVKPVTSSSKQKFFSLDRPSNYKSLSESGLRPQQYDEEDLDSYGIDVAMLKQITPITAQFYSFHSAGNKPGATKTLGSTEALEEIQRKGCTLATKHWVDNHWCLIIWKLAGMVALDPESETIPEKRRWCWDEVIRQLLYRYERELNLGQRPPLRKIVTQDAPSQLPMCLCVSNIIWPPRGVTDDGLPIEPHPELEVTDGWYRLRAQVDQVLARAARKGSIRIGRKLGVAAARLESEKKEGAEILEAYDSVKLVISGNSSQLMPWHAKLGFINGQCNSTLHSLTADGGLVASLDFVIVKMYPIAFLEFIEDDEGNKRREGPRIEADERKEQEKWNRRRELEASKLHEELDKKHTRYENYISRMEQKAGSRYKSPEGEQPQDIESMYDCLEYPETANGTLARLTPLQAGWLAQFTRQQIDIDREKISDEIDQELQKICPPRNVRSFRVLAVQDAKTKNRPANRTAQVTVWDVLSLTLDEDSTAGNFVVGQRYLATNLIPTQPRSWMDQKPGSEIYLSTRRDTRWTKVKTILSAQT